MKKISELMDDLGFDPEGSTAVKEAFIKHLIKASVGTNVLTPTEKMLIKADPIKIKILPQAAAPKAPEQLSFDFSESAELKSKFSRKAHK